MDESLLGHEIERYRMRAEKAEAALADIEALWADDKRPSSQRSDAENMVDQIVARWRRDG